MGIVMVLIVVLVIGGAVALILIGLRESKGEDPLQARLAEYAMRGETTSLFLLAEPRVHVDRVLILVEVGKGVHPIDDGVGEEVAVLHRFHLETGRGEDAG